jgi:hypothetical protein
VTGEAQAAHGFQWKMKNDKLDRKSCFLPTAFCLLPSAFCLLPSAVCRLLLVSFQAQICDGGDKLGGFDGLSEMQLIPGRQGAFAIFSGGIAGQGDRRR